MLKLKLEALILTIEQIPTLPDTTAEILTLIDDDRAGMDTISRFIERDQALALQILKYANSPFYGSTRTVSSVGQALVSIGLNQVKALLLGFTIQQFFSTGAKAEKTRKRFWQHSLVCSHIANYLARALPGKADSSILVSALIHDIGKIVLDQYLHHEFTTIITHVRENNATFAKAERQILGLSHARIGAKLLEQWHFPPRMISQISHHHAPWLATEFREGATIVYLANILTKMAGFPCLPEERVPTMAQFIQSKAMALIKESGFSIDAQRLPLLLRDITALLAGNRNHL